MRVFTRVNRYVLALLVTAIGIDAINRIDLPALWLAVASVEAIVLWIVMADRVTPQSEPGRATADAPLDRPASAA